MVTGLSTPDFPLYHSGTAGIATNSTGDKWIFPVPFKANVMRFGLVVQGSSANATAAVVALDHRVTAGSDTGRVELLVISKTASVSQQGKFLYQDPATSIAVDEGDELVVEVTTADGAANAMTPVVILRQIPEVAGNNSAMVAA